MKYRRDGVYLIEPDRHYPNHDPRVENLIYQTISLVKPTGYINLGDAGDFPQISTHDFDPRKVSRIEDDIEGLNVYWDEIESLMSKDSDIHLLEGNHERRLIRYMMRNAKDTIAITKDWSELYELKTRNSRGRCRWYHHDYMVWDSLRFGDTVVHHGFYFDRHTSSSNLVRYRGCNLIQGHNHRVLFSSNGDHWSASLGHAVVRSKSTHAPAPADHDQAIGILTVHNGKGSLEIISISKRGEAVVRGKRLKG